METNDGVRAGLETTSLSLPSKGIIGASSHCPEQGCVGADDSQVHSCSGEQNSIVQPDSFWDSEVPAATHFSPINFDSWSDMSSFSSGESPEQVTVGPVTLETQCHPRSPVPRSPKCDPNMDYHSIKWGEPGFYDSGSCYYPKNWSNYVPHKEKLKWSIQDNSEYGVLLRETLAEFAAADAKSKMGPESSSSFND